MKLNLLRSLLAATLCATGLSSIHAATLAEATTAYAAPDQGSTVLGTARVGSRIAATPAPSGWMAVELAGPHTVFVAEKDTLKNFDIRPGASYLAAPRPEASVIGVAGAKDDARFADIAGRYNKFSLERSLIGFVKVAPTPIAEIPAAPFAQTAPLAYSESVQAIPAPVHAIEANVLRQDIPAHSPVGAGQGIGAAEPQLARIFFGTIASSQSPFRPRRPHDFQLNDDNGNRFAYLDISNLLLTEKLETFIGRAVSIQGTAKTAKNSRDIIIHVESLKLR